MLFDAVFGNFLFESQKQLPEPSSSCTLQITLYKASKHCANFVTQTNFAAA